MDDGAAPAEPDRVSSALPTYLPATRPRHMPRSNDELLGDSRVQFGAEGAACGFEGVELRAPVTTADVVAEGAGCA